MASVDVELGLIALAAMLSPTTLSFSTLALVLGRQPRRTGLLFFIGAFGATMVIGVVAAFVLGNHAASSKPNTPKTWVAIVDVVAAVLLLVFVWRFTRRPPDRRRVQSAIDQMSKVVNSPAIAIIGAGATLANPGGFIPLALKDVSETNPSAAQYIAEWAGFALIALLPLVVALIALTVSPNPTQRFLVGARGWLERNARKVAVVIVLLLAASLLRNGIAGLTG